ncbi:hypothetical protein KC219_25420, partial [Mycobacterium tuberculosis]|nr:hypothetical protein [Mycobacterium tuberculosis]
GCCAGKLEIIQREQKKKVVGLADGAATVGGELALGKNVLVAYMPWARSNSEDAVLIGETPPQRRERSARHGPQAETSPSASTE